MLPLRILSPLASPYSMAPSGFCLLLSSRPVPRRARQCCHTLSPGSAWLAAFTCQHTCVAATLPSRGFRDTVWLPFLPAHWPLLNRHGFPPLLTSQPPSLGAPEFSPGVLLLRVPGWVTSSSFQALVTASTLVHPSLLSPARRSSSEHHFHADIAPQPHQLQNLSSATSTQTSSHSLLNKCQSYSPQILESSWALFSLNPHI